MEEIIALLRKLPNPQAAWFAIEVELLGEADGNLLKGAILQTVPEKLRSEAEIVAAIANLSTVTIERFYPLYKGDAGEWNNHRKQVRKSVFEGLSIPKLASSAVSL